MAKQREQFRLLQQGKHSFLTPDRLEKLNDAGFVWSVRKDGADDVSSLGSKRKGSAMKKEDDDDEHEEEKIKEEEAKEEPAKPKEDLPTIVDNKGNEDTAVDQVKVEEKEEVKHEDVDVVKV